MEEQYAFIDESGNYGFGFDKQGVSKNFIVTAVIIEKDDRIRLEKEFEEIRFKHFQNGEMKSSNIKSFNRRKRILEDFKDKEFHIYTLIVDKMKLNKDGGLGFKKSFMKYLNSLLYRDLFSTFTHLQMFADEHGSKEFMHEFKKYIRDRHIPDLFNQSSFGFADSKDSILIQVADIISGTFFNIYENPKKYENEKLLQLIKDKIIRIKEWPHSTLDHNVQLSHKNYKEHENIIKKQSVNLARQFILKYESNKEPNNRDQVNFLKFLLLNITLNPEDYISSNEIIENLEVFKKEQVNIQNLRSRIIAPLRDKGLLIASSEKGYKLPISTVELIEYVNFSSLTILPMLERVGKARDRILLATKNELDILDYPEYEKMKRYFDN